MATYYVDPDDGDDGNSGTSTGDAWQTFDHALAQLGVGDILYAKTGTTYREKNNAIIMNNGSSASPIQIIFDTAGDIWDYSFGDVTVDYSGLSSGTAWTNWGRHVIVKQNGGQTITFLGNSSISAIAPGAPSSRIEFRTPIYFDTWNNIIYSNIGGYVYMESISFASIDSFVAYSAHPSNRFLIANVETSGGQVYAESGVIEIVRGTLAGIRQGSGGHVIVHDSGSSQGSVQSLAYHVYDSVYYNSYASYYAQGYVMTSTDVSSPTGQPNVIKAVLADASQINEGLIPFKWIYVPNTANNATIHIYVRPVSYSLTEKQFYIAVIYKNSGGLYKLEFSNANSYTLNADTWTELTYTTQTAVASNEPMTIWGVLCDTAPGQSSQTLYVDTYLNVTF